MPPDLPDFFDRLSRLAAAETLPRFRAGTAITDKGAEKGAAFDPVTDADREAERVMRDAIGEAFPDHGILGEEHGEKPGNGPWRWVIDPVDGTRAFVSGVPMWTTLVGLERDGVPVAGMISQAYLGEDWVGVPGIGTTYRRGDSQPQAVRASGETRLDRARITVTDIRDGEYLSSGEAAAILDLTRSCRLCRMGTDAYGFALVASGAIDLAVEAALNWYDIAAVVPVVEGAGGIACTWQGEPITTAFPGGRIILAATQALADQAVERLKDIPLA